MSKRAANDAHDGQPFPKAPSGSKRENPVVDEMGEFEDAWEDEIESDEDVVDASKPEEEDNEDGLRSSINKYHHDLTCANLSRNGCG